MTREEAQILAAHYAELVQGNHPDATSTEDDYHVANATKELIIQKRGIPEALDLIAAAVATYRIINF